MKSFLCVLFIFITITHSIFATQISIEEDDFSEFNDNDYPQPAVENVNSKPEIFADIDTTDYTENDATTDGDTFLVEDEDEEAIVQDEVADGFNHFADDEEFEGYYASQEDEEETSFDTDEFEHKPDENILRSKKQSKTKMDTSSLNSDKVPPKPLNFAKLPSHFRKNWEQYQLEILVIVLLFIYLVNYVTGKLSNYKIATEWLKCHIHIFDKQFAMVGDVGLNPSKMSSTDQHIDRILVKQSENIYSMWCSGRACCEGMLLELLLLKRQDLVSVVSNLIKPAYDQIHLKFLLSEHDMEHFVFCVANKRVASSLVKKMYDLRTFCPEKRVGEKFGLPSNFVVLSELTELCTSLLDSNALAVIAEAPECIESIHFSDMYMSNDASADVQDSGDSTSSPVNELELGKRVLSFVFNIVPGINSSGSDSTKNLDNLLNIAFYFLDKIKRFRLSHEGTLKSEKNRSKIADNYRKSLHVVQAEKAQEERERKKREWNDKLMDIQDPQRQKKMEEKENKRNKKKNGPKMKQLKIKSM